MKSKEDLDLVFADELSIPREFGIEKPIRQGNYLINGELKDWFGPYDEVLSPIYVRNNDRVVQKIVGSYPRLSGKEALEALDAACNAYGEGGGLWPTMSVSERIACVEDFLFRVKDKRSEVVKLLMWEIGKSRLDSEKEFDRTIVYVRDTIDALKDLDRASARFVIEEGIISQVRRAPLGVVLCMGPFNYPLNETYTTLIPALMMGNTIVFKPPRYGVLLHEPLLEAFCQSFPKGVVNAVYGDGKDVIPPIMETGKVACLGFIGTSRVADLLKSMHPKLHRMRSILGLEAKNPAIVLKDADLGVAIKECVTGALSFNGQRCTALKIIFVDNTILPTFLEKLSKAVDELKVGMPWDEGVSITPLPEANKPSYLLELVEDAKSLGASIVNERGAISLNGIFCPAVLCPVNEKMRIYHEEQFGPVVPVVPFDDFNSVLEYMRESNYGQQISIFGEDPARIAELIDPLVNQVCRVNINSQCQRGPDELPFTGRKDSAEGTLSVSDALRAFSIRTLVAMKDTPSNKKILTEILSKRQSKFLSTDFVF